MNEMSEIVSMKKGKKMMRKELMCPQVQQVVYVLLCLLFSPRKLIILIMGRYAVFCPEFFPYRGFLVKISQNTAKIEADIPFLRWDCRKFDIIAMF